MSIIRTVPAHPQLVAQRLLERGLRKAERGGWGQLDPR